MLNIAVIIQLLGLVLTFAIGKPGYVLGPALIIIGGVIYRRERMRRKRDAIVAPVSPSQPPPKIRRGWMIAAGVAGLFAAAIVLAFYLTGGLVESANGFFAAVRSNDLDKAKTYLSEEFAAASSTADLKAFLEHSALARYQSSSWSSRSIQNSRGELQGVVTTSGGGAIPLRILFVREHGDWKIYSMQKPTAGLRRDNEPRDTAL